MTRAEDDMVLCWYEFETEKRNGKTNDNSRIKCGDETDIHFPLSLQQLETIAQAAFFCGSSVWFGLSDRDPVYWVFATIQPAEFVL